MNTFKKTICLLLSILFVISMPILSFGENSNILNETNNNYTIECDPVYYTLYYGYGERNYHSIYVKNSGTVNTPSLEFYFKDGTYFTVSDYEMEYIPAGADIYVDAKLQTGLPIGKYSDVLIVKEQNSENEYEIEVEAEVIKKTINVFIRIDNKEKDAGTNDPEFTFSVSSSLNSYSPDVSGSLQREQGENPGKYRIYCDDFVLNNDITDDYNECKLIVTDGYLTINEAPFVVGTNYLTDDGNGAFNDRAVTVSLIEGCGFDLLSLDAYDWKETLVFDEEGVVEKTYIIYLKNSSTGRTAYCKYLLKFDHITQDSCVLTRQSGNGYDVQLLITMRNLSKVTYSIDGGTEKEAARIGYNEGKYTYGISLLNGKHDYVVYIKDVEGRTVEYSYNDLGSTINLSVFQYRSMTDYNENRTIGSCRYKMQYGDKFQLPDDYTETYAARIVGWAKNRIKWADGSITYDEVSEEELSYLTNSTMELFPLLVPAIPDELISFEIPSLPTTEEIEIINSLITAIDEFKAQSIYYDPLTEEDKAFLDEYYSALQAALKNDTHEHIWGEWETAKEPNCYEAGERTHTCTVCGATETEPTEKLPNPFIDVPGGKWYTKAVLFCKAYGYMSGTSDTAFSPSAKVTRAMTVTILWRMAGAESVDTGNPFKDVPAGKWYTKAVLWAKKTGVVAGTGDNTFSPYAKVTREQLALMFMQYTDKIIGGDVSPRADLIGYADAESIHPWARDSVSWAVATGLISGKGNGILDPRGTATRAELAQIIFKYLNNK